MSGEFMVFSPSVNYRSPREWALINYGARHGVETDH